MAVNTYADGVGRSLTLLPTHCRHGKRYLSCDECWTRYLDVCYALNNWDKARRAARNEYEKEHPKRADTEHTGFYKSR